MRQAVREPVEILVAERMLTANGSDPLRESLDPLLEELGQRRAAGVGAPRRAEVDQEATPFVGRQQIAALHRERWIGGEPREERHEALRQELWLSGQEPLGVGQQLAVDPVPALP